MAGDGGRRRLIECRRQEIALRLKLQSYGVAEGPHGPALVAAIGVAARALSDAGENGIELNLSPGELDVTALMAIRDRLAANAWDADLFGEAAFGSIHPEHSGWGLPVTMAPATPWLIGAIDVLDWLGGLLGPADRLVVSEDE